MSITKSVLFILLMLAASATFAQKQDADTTLANQPLVTAYDSVIAKADSAISMEDFDKAKEYYQQAIILQPNNPFPVRMLRTIENSRRAVAESKAHDLDLRRKAEINRLMVEASKDVLDKNYDSARARYTRILSLNPIKSQEEFARKKIEVIDLALGRSPQTAAVQSGISTPALTDLTAKAESSTQNRAKFIEDPNKKTKTQSDYLMDTAVLAIANRNYEQARELFQKIITSNSTKAQKDFAKTKIEAIDAALKKVPEKPAERKESFTLIQPGQIATATKPSTDTAKNAPLVVRSNNINSNQVVKSLNDTLVKDTTNIAPPVVQNATATQKQVAKPANDTIDNTKKDTAKNTPAVVKNADTTSPENAKTTNKTHKSIADSIKNPPAFAIKASDSFKPKTDGIVLTDSSKLANSGKSSLSGGLATNPVSTDSTSTPKIVAENKSKVTEPKTKEPVTTLQLKEAPPAAKSTVSNLTPKADTTQPIPSAAKNAGDNTKTKIDSGLIANNTTVATDKKTQSLVKSPNETLTDSSKMTSLITVNTAKANSTIPEVKQIKDSASSVPNTNPRKNTSSAETKKAGEYDDVKSTPLVDGLLEKGMIAENHDNWSEALAAYKEVLTLHPSKKQQEFVEAQIAVINERLQKAPVVKNTVPASSIKKTSQNRNVNAASGSASLKTISENSLAVHKKSTAPLMLKNAGSTATQEPNKQHISNSNILLEEQTFDLTDKENSEENAEFSKRILNEPPSLQLSDSVDNVKITCQKISSNGKNIFLRFLVTNTDSNTGFIPGTLQLMYIKNYGPLIRLNARYISDLPVSPQKNEYSFVYVAQAPAAVAPNEVFIFEMQDQMKKTKLTINIPGEVYLKQKNN